MNPELLADWLTIWHSELAGIALDRELLEGAAPFWHAGLNAAGVARPDAPPRPSAADVASDPHDREIARLAARLEAVERKLALLD